MPVQTGGPWVPISVRYRDFPAGELYARYTRRTPWPLAGILLGVGLTLALGGQAPPPPGQQVGNNSSSDQAGTSSEDARTRPAGRGRSVEPSVASQNRTPPRLRPAAGAGVLARTVTRAVTDPQSDRAKGLTAPPTSMPSPVVRMSRRTTGGPASTGDRTSDSVVDAMPAPPVLRRQARSRFLHLRLSRWPQRRRARATVLTSAPRPAATVRRPAAGVIAGLRAASQLDGDPIGAGSASLADVIAVAFVRRGVHRGRGQWFRTATTRPRRSARGLVLVPQSDPDAQPAPDRAEPGGVNQRHPQRC